MARECFASDAAAELWQRRVEAMLAHDHPRVVFTGYTLAFAEWWPFCDEYGQDLALTGWLEWMERHGGREIARRDIALELQSKV